ncbi:MAG: 16S rRNA (uracil(1498)-N(3))-methyltransferase [Betaproteobacteria bacterium]|nr:16S rRNA (uracil(1498)-N(3))-methyltransferase [Betaproteobacteria bacterium]
MSLPRFYCPGPIAVGAEVALPEAAAHHALRVLRLQPGDGVVLFNGGGGEYVARISRADRGRVATSVLEWRDVDRESELRVRLVQGLCSAERMDWLLQKAVELGVGAVQPVVAARSVVRLHGERADKRAVHWRGVMISACEQCGRNRVPELAPLQPFPAWIAGIPAAAPDALRILLAPEAATRLSALPKPRGEVALLVGPEGGWNEEESRAAVAGGFLPVRLGERVLRTETVALAALAAMHALWGEF